MTMQVPPMNRIADSRPRGTFLFPRRGSLHPNAAPVKGDVRKWEWIILVGGACGLQPLGPPEWTGRVLKELKRLQEGRIVVATKNFQIIKKNCF